MAKLTPQEIADSPTVTLGGQKFHIPRLAVRQNRVVVAKLGSILPTISRFEGLTKLGKDEVAAAILKDFPFDEQTFDACSDAVYAALTRGQPELTRDEFDDLEIGVDELIMSLQLVLMQSFAFMKRGAAADAPQGEAPPAVDPKTSTGTAS